MTLTGRKSNMFSSMSGSSSQTIGLISRTPSSNSTGGSGVSPGVSGGSSGFAAFALRANSGGRGWVAAFAYDCICPVRCGSGVAYRACQASVEVEATALASLQLALRLGVVELVVLHGDGRTL